VVVLVAVVVLVVVVVAVVLLEVAVARRVVVLGVVMAVVAAVVVDGAPVVEGTAVVGVGTEVVATGAVVSTLLLQAEATSSKATRTAYFLTVSVCHPPLKGAGATSEPPGVDTRGRCTDRDLNSLNCRASLS